MLNNWRGRDSLYFLITLLMGFLLTMPMAWHWREIGDFEYHNIMAGRLLTTPDEVLSEVPNFLYHLLSSLPHALIPAISVASWGALVMTMSAVATGGVLLWEVRRLYRHDKAMSHTLWWAWVGAIGAFLVVVPINLFTPENLYFGYFTNNIYHNPTTNLMKPFALLLFFWTLRLYDADFQPERKGLWLMAYIVVALLGLLAKPSFIIAFLPALALLTLYTLLKRQKIHWLLLLGGVVLPSVALIFYQTFVMTSPEAGGSIRIEPLRVFLEWTLHYDINANVGLPEKLLLSIAFPLLVYALYGRSAWRNRAFNTAWLTLIISLIYAYMLVDDTEIAAGNFTWSAQMAVVILFAVALLTLARHKITWRTWASVALLGVHLVAGVHWYILHMTTTYPDLIFIWW